MRNQYALVQMTKQTPTSMHQILLVIRRNKSVMHATIWVNPKDIKPSQKVLYDSIYIKFLKITKLYRWRTDWWLAGVRDEERGWVAIKSRKKASGGGIVLYIRCGGSCTNLQM